MEYRLDGVIASAAFASGDRIVVGAWRDGPLGPMNDVMWADATGKRTLIAPRKDVADFVSGIYEFDDIQIADVVVGQSSRSFAAGAAGLKISLSIGRKWPIFVKRPPAFTQYVEGPIAKRLMGVNTHGTTKSGVEEWYQASSVRWVNSGHASFDGKDLGALVNIDPLRVGVSEPPRRPSVVKVRPLLKVLNRELIK